MSQENYSTLWEHLACIQDPRSRRGQQHEWTYIMTLLGAALLAGKKTLLDMSEWVSMNSAVFIEFLKPRRQRVPSYATLRRALCQLDIAAFERHLAAYTQQVNQDDSWSGRIETQAGTVLQGQSVAPRGFPGEGRVLPGGHLNIRLQPVAEAQVWSGDVFGVLWECFRVDSQSGEQWQDELSRFWRTVEDDMGLCLTNAPPGATRLKSA